MNTILYAAAGVGILAGVWFAYLCVTKGVPYAWGKVSTWWNAEKAALQADIATLKADVAAIKTKVGA